jgi:hypothetical protein
MGSEVVPVVRTVFCFFLKWKFLFLFLGCQGYWQATTSHTTSLLNGNVTRGGSETGTATLKALGSGKSRVDLAQMSGTHTSSRPQRCHTEIGSIEARMAMNLVTVARDLIVEQERGK